MSKTLLITLNYNANLLIKNLYESLVTYLPKDSWNWLIRDNSDKEKIDFIDDSRVEILDFKNEGNYSAQHNMLLKYGYFEKYKNICLLNNDMIALNDFLTPMETLISKEDVGAVGARLFYPNGQLQHSGVCITNDLMPFNVNHYAMKKANLWQTLPEKKRIFQAVTGACLMISVDDYKKLGGMDESFNWCFDDVDLCLRVTQELKKLCVYTPDAQLVHLENYSTLKNPTELKPNFPDAFQKLKAKFKNNLKSDLMFYQAEYGEYK